MKEKKGRNEHPRRGAVFCIKVLLFLILFLLFFGLFAPGFPQVFGFSRTAAITMTTFVILGISMTAVYGGFAVGKRKSKEIIPSLCIAVFITDAVTFLQLYIMSVSRWPRADLIWLNLMILFCVFLLQVAAVIAFVYLGNYVYFKLNPPDRCVIVCDHSSNPDQLVKCVSRYRKQFKIDKVLTWDDPQLKKRIRKTDIVFLYDIPASERPAIIEYAYKHYTNLYVQSDISEILLNTAKFEMFDDMAMLHLPVTDLSMEQRFFKRALDLFVSGIATIVLSPLMLIIAIAIKLDDHGPVFFSQPRATRGGKIFNVLKFRTMKVHDPSVEYSATADDDRITRVGKYLRKFRVDEIPQILNILHGEMSLVGPRPEMLQNIEKYTEELPEFQYRLRVKAGLTGLAQVNGRYNTSAKDKLILDLMYIERYSFWQDIVLLLRTVIVFFKSEESTQGFEASEKKPDVTIIKHETEENQMHPEA